MGGAIPHNTVRGHRPKGCPSHCRGRVPRSARWLACGESPPGEVSRGPAAPGRTRGSQDSVVHRPESLRRILPKSRESTAAGLAIRGRGRRGGRSERRRRSPRSEVSCLAPRSTEGAGGGRWVAGRGRGRGRGTRWTRALSPFPACWPPPRRARSLGAGPGSHLASLVAGSRARGRDRCQSRARAGPGSESASLVVGARTGIRVGPGPGSERYRLLWWRGAGRGPGPAPAPERGRLLWWRGAVRGAGTGTGAGSERSGCPSRLLWWRGAGRGRGRDRGRSGVGGGPRSEPSALVVGRGAEIGGGQTPTRRLGSGGAGPVPGVASGGRSTGSVPRRRRAADRQRALRAQPRGCDFSGLGFLWLGC